MSEHSFCRCCIRLRMSAGHLPGKTPINSCFVWDSGCLKSTGFSQNKKGPSRYQKWTNTDFWKDQNVVLSSIKLNRLWMELEWDICKFHLVYNHRLNGQCGSAIVWFWSQNTPVWEAILQPESAQLRICVEPGKKKTNVVFPSWRILLFPKELRRWQRLLGFDRGLQLCKVSCHGDHSS